MDPSKKVAASLALVSALTIAGSALAQTGTGSTDDDDTPGLPDTGGGWSQSL